MTAADLPYFEGDYWPGEAENVLATVAADGAARAKSGAASSSRAKGGVKGGSKRGATPGAPPPSPDAALMARLGDVIGGMRDDFIVVHLRDPCTHCRKHPEGTYWRWPPLEATCPAAAAADAASAAAAEAAAAEKAAADGKKKAAGDVDAKKAAAKTALIAAAAATAEAAAAAAAAAPPVPGGGGGAGKSGGKAGGGKGGGKASVPAFPPRVALCASCYDAEKKAVAKAGAVKPDPDAPAVPPLTSTGPPPPGAPKGLPYGVTLDQLVRATASPLPPTEDANPDVGCEFFDTRQAFLSLCQGNHYQFDTLRRAKHSSMMVLYHLHNPDAPAFACTCNVCSREIEPGAGFRCTVCADFDMCATCRLNPAVRHPHPLAAHARAIDETRARLTDAERRERAAQLARTMALLRHASGCTDARCTSSNCAKVKALFQHAGACPLKVTGGCGLCRRLWLLLQMHAKACVEAACPVPRCRELRDLRRRQAARQEEARRAAYQAMLRAQAGAGRAY